MSRNWLCRRSAPGRPSRPRRAHPAPAAPRRSAEGLDLVCSSCATPSRGRDPSSSRRGGTGTAGRRRGRLRDRVGRGPVQPLVGELVSCGCDEDGLAALPAESPRGRRGQEVSIDLTTLGRQANLVDAAATRSRSASVRRECSGSASAVEGRRPRLEGALIAVGGEALERGRCQKSYLDPLAAQGLERLGLAVEPDDVGLPAARVALVRRPGRRRDRAARRCSPPRSASRRRSARRALGAAADPTAQRMSASRQSSSTARRTPAMRRSRGGAAGGPRPSWASLVVMVPTPPPAFL